MSTSLLLASRSYVMRSQETPMETHNLHSLVNQLSSTPAVQVSVYQLLPVIKDKQEPVLFGSPMSVWA